VLGRSCFTRFHSFCLYMSSFLLDFP
jgi:hypothetical protein